MALEWQLQGFWLPTIIGPEGFAVATSVCPPGFERTFCITFTAETLSAPITTSATRMPPSIILSERFRGWWSCSLTAGLTFRWSLNGLRRGLFIQNEGRRMILQDVPKQSLRYNIQCCTLYCNATNEDPIGCPRSRRVCSISPRTPLTSIARNRYASK